jgi:hypothetical protein
MQLTSHLASLILAFSALAAAAPAASPGSTVVVRDDSVHVNHPAVEFSKRDEGIEIFAREKACDAVRDPKDKVKQKKYDDKMKEMSAATVKAHQGENMCKPGDFIKEKNKQIKERIKNKCIDGYDQ